MRETKHDWSGPTAPSRPFELRDGFNEKGPRPARKTLRLLFSRATQLTHFPDIERGVPELLGSELRELIEKRYRIVYRVREKTVEIATVFEGVPRAVEIDVGE